MIPYTKPPLFLSNIFLAPHFNMCYNIKELKITNKRHHLGAERLSWNQILERTNLTAISLPDQGGYFLAFLPISYPILYAAVHKILAIPKA